MTTTPASERVRASALALLADGNSPRSVANVLELPIAAVEALQRSPLAMLQGGEDPGFPTQGAPMSSTEFDCDLIHRVPRRGLVAMLWAGFVLATEGFIWSTWARVPWTLTAAVFLPIALPLSVMSALAFRVRFVLGRRAVSARGYLRTRSLDYGDVASFDCNRVDTLVPSGRMRGYRLIFRPRDGQRALSFFVDDFEPLPAAMTDRLKRLPFVVPGALGAMDRGQR